MKRGIAVLIALISMVVWLKLADHLLMTSDGPFAWAGLVSGVLASGIAALIALAASVRAIWRQPADVRAFWVLFSLMMGSTVGMILFVLYDGLVLRKS